MPTSPDLTATEIDEGAVAAKPSRRRRLRFVAVALLAVGVLGVAGTACTPQQISQIAVSNYFTAAQQDCAMRIIQRESNYQAGAISPDGNNIGLFQINRVHSAWIQSTYGYAFGDLIDANKNAQVARGLSDAAQSYYGDQWQPWRIGGQVIPGGGCPA